MNFCSLCGRNSERALPAICATNPPTTLICSEFPYSIFRRVMLVDEEYYPTGNTAVLVGNGGIRGILRPPTRAAPTSASAPTVIDLLIELKL